MPKISKYKIKSSNIAKDSILCYKLINKFMHKKIVNSKFSKLWLKKLKQLKKKDYNILNRTNKSNGIKMQYNIISIKKNTSFQLHIHPTIELIYIIKGVLYEDRFNKIISKKKIQYIKNKKDLSKGKFITKSHKKGKFLLNDIGSVHNSYTKGSDTIIFVLWGGKHHIIK